MAALLVISTSCAAGSEQAAGRDATQIAENIHFSKRVERVLAEHRAEVAIVARVGRPRKSLPEPLRFTHVGIAVYSQISTAEGQRLPGYVFYNLYQDRKNKLSSYLAQDSAVNFFAEVVELEAGILMPVGELQQRLKKFVTSAQYQSLHRRDYSVLANPFDLRFQNCTEFVLDTLTAVIYHTADARQIKANLRAHFAPTQLEVSKGKLLLAQVFNEAVLIADHPREPQIASFQSIAAYLSKHSALRKKIIVY